MTRTILKRLEKAEAATRSTETIAERIYAGRRRLLKGELGPLPSRTRVELEAEAKRKGIRGRMARGWLRIGHFR